MLVAADLKEARLGSHQMFMGIAAEPASSKPSCSLGVDGKSFHIRNKLYGKSNKDGFIKSSVVVMAAHKRFNCRLLDKSRLSLLI